MDPSIAGDQGAYARPGALTAPTRRPRGTRTDYDRVSWCYDGLAHGFSLGRIRAARLSQLRHLSAGQRVLYVGAGSGEDAVAAAAMGCRVTCLDVSRRMLARAQRRFAEAGAHGSFVCADVTAFRPARLFDAVVANFFFNVFPPDQLPKIWASVILLMSPRGGRLMIADPTPASGARVARAIQTSYWRVAWAFFRAQGLAVNPHLRDYAEMLTTVGFEMEAVNHFPLFARSPAPCYTSWVARMPSERESIRSRSILGAVQEHETSWT